MLYESIQIIPTGETYKQNAYYNPHIPLISYCIICFNSLIVVDSLDTSQTLPIFQSTSFQPGLNDSKINLLFLSIVNNLAPNPEKLHFFSSFVNESGIELKSGKPFYTFTYFEVHSCIMVWNPKCKQFNVYDLSHHP